MNNTQPGHSDSRHSDQSHQPEDLPQAKAAHDSNEQIAALVAHNARTQLVPGLLNGAGVLSVQKWDSTKAARGWTLTGADLTLDCGRPFGALYFRHNQDERIVRVGVRWNHDVEQLEALSLHPREPRLADNVNGSEAAALERDVRSRVGTLLTSNASIGSFVASSRESENALLAASGLGLKRLDPTAP
ncbi:hypothetical protein [Leifsonia sp. EB34]|uniref:hypothetical protein n=1 Tax=Leifsonia sp. EB34 TaxID=3156303 RepID=UPI003513225B